MVYGTCLESRRSFGARGFESHPFRQVCSWCSSPLLRPLKIDPNTVGACSRASFPPHGELFKPVVKKTVSSTANRPKHGVRLFPGPFSPVVRKSDTSDRRDLSRCGSNPRPPSRWFSVFTRSLAPAFRWCSHRFLRKRRPQVRVLSHPPGCVAQSVEHLSFRGVVRSPESLPQRLRWPCSLTCLRTLAPSFQW